jgi:LPXTG-motif cell wall-anchored protein
MDDTTVSIILWIGAGIVLALLIMRRRKRRILK